MSKLILWLSLLLISIIKEVIFNQLSLIQAQNYYWARFKIEWLFDIFSTLPKSKIPTTKAALLLTFALIGVGISSLLSKKYKIEKLYFILGAALLGLTCISGIGYLLSESVKLKSFSISLIGLYYTPLPVFCTLLLSKYLSNAQRSEGKLK